MAKPCQSMACSFHSVRRPIEGPGTENAMNSQGQSMVAKSAIFWHTQQAAIGSAASSHLTTCSTGWKWTGRPSEPSWKRWKQIGRRSARS